jgi:hypothetical protein
MQTFVIKFVSLFFQESLLIIFKYLQEVSFLLLRIIPPFTQFTSEDVKLT